MVSISHAKSIYGDSFFHNDEQPEVNLENNKTEYNLKTNSSISIL